MLSAFLARQQVNSLVLDRLSDMLLADDPELVTRPDGRLVWRVPVDLTFASRGRVGRVGVLDVDAQQGEVIFSVSDLIEIEKEARRLAEG